VTLPQVRVLTGPARNFGRHWQTFSPTTSTLVTASTEAVLVDTPTSMSLYQAAVMMAAGIRWMSAKPVETKGLSSKH
jgi:hypothetical protein